MTGVQLQLNMVSTGLQLSEGEMADSKAKQGKARQARAKQWRGRGKKGNKVTMATGIARAKGVVRASRSWLWYRRCRLLWQSYVM